MEYSMIFCQKNTLEHSLSLHKKRCIPTTRVKSDIVTHQTNISEMKYMPSKGFFTTKRVF